MHYRKSILNLCLYNSFAIWPLFLFELFIIRACFSFPTKASHIRGKWYEYCVNLSSIHFIRLTLKRVCFKCDKQNSNRMYSYVLLLKIFSDFSTVFLRIIKNCKNLKIVFVFVYLKIYKFYLFIFHFFLIF